MGSRPRVPIPRHRRRARTRNHRRALPATARALPATTAGPVSPPPAPMPYGAPPPPGYYGAPPKKTRWGLIIALVGGIFALLAVAAIVFVVIVGKGTVTATDVKVGDCLKEIPGNTRVLTVDTVGCDKPHAGEVFAVLLMPEGDYPGAVRDRGVPEQVRARAGLLCTRRDHRRLGAAVCAVSDGRNVGAGRSGGDLRRHPGSAADGIAQGLSRSSKFPVPEVPSGS